MSSYDYDTDSSMWPFFAFTVTAITTVPATYFLLKGSINDPSKLFPRVQTDYKPKHADLVAAQRAKDRKQNRRVGLTIFVLLGWAVMAYTLYLIHYVETPAVQRTWNPYDILGISEVSLCTSYLCYFLKAKNMCSPLPRKPSSLTTENCP
jgi:translocation protein SEC63